MRCGLLGEKLGHSYSPQIHACLGDYSYDLMEMAPEKLGEFLKYGDFSGLNVTIPYKKAVIPYCAELTPIARVYQRTTLLNILGPHFLRRVPYRQWDSNLVRAAFFPYALLSHSTWHIPSRLYHFATAAWKIC